MRPSKRSELAGLLVGIPLVDPAARDRLRGLLAPVSDSYLRKLLRESGVALHPLVEGVRQHSFPELERTLLALAAVYLEAVSANDAVTAREARGVLIEAKDHARLAARRHPEDTTAAEKIRWMLVWLENPPVFETWLRLRKKALGLPL
jgi:hypothetical protein